MSIDRLRWLPCALALACGEDGGPAKDAQLPAFDAEADASAHVEAGAPLDASRDAASDASDTAVADAGMTMLQLPPTSGRLDYQLGGAYAPPAGVNIVTRDRKATPLSGVYNICYVNGFQAQEAENDFWLQQHPDLLLRDEGGEPVVDRNWDEMLLDIGTQEKRTRLLEVVGGFIAGCARAGFDAVEIDNLDSYTRSDGRLQEADAVAFIAGLARIAHENGVAIAQKNSSELASRKAELGTDFAVAEECSRYDECDVYTDAYGEHVLMIEYRRNDFESGCARYASYPIVLRDLNLVPQGRQGYVFDDC